MIKIKWKNLSLKLKLPLYFSLYPILGILLISLAKLIKYPSLIHAVLSFLFFPVILLMYATGEFGEGGKIFVFYFATIVIQVLIFGILGFLVGCIFDLIRRR